MTMVAQLFTNNQVEDISRQQRRAQERGHIKLQKKLEKLASLTNLPMTFDNETVTDFGNFGLFEAFKKVVGFPELLKRHVEINRHHNCLYSPEQLAPPPGRFQEPCYFDMIRQ